MPGNAADPDTSTAFASGITGTLVDLAVDPSGNLDYLTNSGIVGRISYTPGPSPPANGTAPSITSGPQNQLVNAGQVATFTVTASGSAPLAYQWQHLIGTTWVNVGTSAPTYVITAATSADAGLYRVDVSNAAGSIQSGTATLTVNSSSSLPPTSVAPVPGLKAEFFDFRKRLRALPNLQGRVPDVTRTDAVLAYAPTGTPWPGLDARFATTYATLHTGYLDVDTPGRYTLALSSSDGSKLWLDGKLLINNGGLHPLRTRTRTIRLSAGPHALRVEYFDNAARAALILSWSGPAIARQVVPAQSLFQSVVE
jgi:hypothetical protein